MPKTKEELESSFSFSNFESIEKCPKHKEGQKTR
jgi:hypothetical protein